MTGWRAVAVALGALVLGAVAGAVMGRFTAERALDRAPATPGAPSKPALGERLAVTSDPAGATVSLNGRLVGKTPIARLELDAGRHAVAVELRGYTPWADNLVVAAGADAGLEVLLAPAGKGPSKAKVRGAVTLGGDPVAAAPGPDAAPDARAEPARPAAARPRPRVPTRDCDGERRTCREHCDSASFSCRSSCQYCGSCVTSMTWDECNRICNTCRQGCEQNTKFCESSCEAQHASCQP